MINREKARLWKFAKKRKTNDALDLMGFVSPLINPKIKDKLSSLLQLEIYRKVSFI